jgi:hypothetical protein
MEARAVAVLLAAAFLGCSEFSSDQEPKTVEHGGLSARVSGVPVQMDRMCQLLNDTVYVALNQFRQQTWTTTTLGGFENVYYFAHVKAVDEPDVSIVCVLAADLGDGAMGGQMVLVPSGYDVTKINEWASQQWWGKELQEPEE